MCKVCLALPLQATAHTAFYNAVHRNHNMGDDSRHVLGCGHARGSTVLQKASAVLYLATLPKATDQPSDAEKAQHNHLLRNLQPALATETIQMSFLLSNPP